MDNEMADRIKGLCKNTITDFLEFVVFLNYKLTGFTCYTIY